MLWSVSGLNDTFPRLGRQEGRESSVKGSTPDPQSDLLVLALPGWVTSGQLPNCSDPWFSLL